MHLKENFSFNKIFSEIRNLYISPKFKTSSALSNLIGIFSILKCTLFISKFISHFKLKIHSQLKEILCGIIYELVFLHIVHYLKILIFITLILILEYYVKVIFKHIKPRWELLTFALYIF